MLRDLKCHFPGKKGWFCQNLLKFFSSQTHYGVKFEAKSHKILAWGWFLHHDLTCLGVYFKTVVHAFLHLHIWVAPWDYYQKKSSHGQTIRYNMGYLRVSKAIQLLFKPAWCSCRSLDIQKFICDVTVTSLCHNSQII